jgi:hypothetical protein
MSDDEPDLAILERHQLALYEARLAAIGKRGTEAEEDIKARQWAACVLGEAMCVLELQFGKDAAEEMVQAMIASRACYTGPRTKRVRQ